MRIVAALTLLATPAFAHTGEHHGDVGHLFTSGDHLAVLVLGALALGFLLRGKARDILARVMRKRRDQD